MIINETLAKASLAGGVTIALLFGVGAAALAQDATVIGERPSDDVITERVPYGDLNLASKAGEKALHFRVRGAVRRVCDPQFGTQPYMACRSYAWGGAKPQMERAIERARQLAYNGTTTLAPVAIRITAPR